MLQGGLSRGFVVLGVAVAVAAACSGTGGEDDESTSVDTDRAASDVVYASTHPEPESLEVVEPPEQPGVQILEHRFGPFDVLPGQNHIGYSGSAVQKPSEDGYIVSITPDVVRDDGTVPPVDVVHLHHGVWANLSASPGERAAGGGLAELFLAAGEEKTTMILPPGYGYEYQSGDTWTINYMIHNLTSERDRVSITYDIGFIPKSAPEAAGIVPVRPVWMDVQKGQIYPVFDVLRGSGGDGELTYPDEADNPYGAGLPLNEWTVDRDSVLVSWAGHLHPGGLHVDLWARRDGAADRAHLFQSDAVYYEPAGAVSWDVSMTVTPPDWRVAVRAGDILSISTTYDSERASWYESMGLGVLWIADGTDGVDPFAEAVDPQRSVLTHGHLAENDNHGGEETGEFVDATEMPDGHHADTVTVADYTYAPGDIGGIYDTVPTVEPGGTLTFTNQDAPTPPFGVWHTITACTPPCTGSTGVAYPLADADVQFDSGQLGVAGPPTAGRVDWTIPADLEPGTYTYFCRVHPGMRGAFRVVEPSG